MSKKNKNKHGLTRSIPVGVKREVRERCGFGCVICGKIPYHYDHFRTPWPEAKKHDPDDIILLCFDHHLGEKTPGSISVDEIEEFLLKNPVQEREAFLHASILTENFRIEWPSIDFIGTNSNIVIDGDEVINFERTGNPRNPIWLSGVFYDDVSRESCRIEKNEFISSPNVVGDITKVSNTLQISSKSGRTTLKVCFQPGRLIIEEVYMIRNKAYVIANSEKFIVGNGDSYAEITGSMIAHCRTSIAVNSGSRPLYIMDNEIQFPKSFSSLKGSVARGSPVGIEFGF